MYISVSRNNNSTRLPIEYKSDLEASVVERKSSKRHDFFSKRTFQGPTDVLRFFNRETLNNSFKIKYL